MSQSAISNLSESLELVRGTIEAILDKEAEFQKLIAQEVSLMENPEEFIQRKILWTEAGQIPR